MSAGRVRAIFFSLERGRPSKYTQQAILMGNFGIQGDRHSRENVDNQLLLVSFKVLQDLNLKPGQIFENITIDGMDVDALPRGTQLRVGETSLVEITRPCPPCAVMDGIRTGLKQALKDRRGMYARVVRGGLIHLDDPIAPLSQHPAQEPKRSG